MDTTNEIFEYLPLQYKNSSDLDYFNFLINSVQQNFEAENYHFAVVALHMIYMGIVYHYIYGIFRADKERFKLVLIGFENFLKDKAVSSFDDLSWHNFSIINEAQIFQFYKAVGIGNNEIGNLKKPVSDRNNILHTNGSYISDISEFEEKENQYLVNLGKINEFCGKEYEKLYLEFLQEVKIEITDEVDAEEFLIQNFIKEYGINQKIILDLSEMDKKDYPKNIEIFFDVLQNMKVN